jgi:sugar/nucleoside kinase (ribokinase family)
VINGVTVLGNLAVDRVDAAPPSPGGCPSFAFRAFEAVGVDGHVVTRCAQGDWPLFERLLDGRANCVTVLPAAKTSAFGLCYSGDTCVMTVDAIGEQWTPDDVAAGGLETEWVHVAPLLRSDFPAETLARLVAMGHRISYDGQGLIRVPTTGELTVDTAYDRGMLELLSVLKLNEAEASVVAGGIFDVRVAVGLGVGEILVTLGSHGCDVYVDGEVTHVPARPIRGVHATGAGDTFMVAYLTGRASGAEPVPAALGASELVAKMLEERRVNSGGTTGMAPPAHTA